MNYKSLYGPKNMRIMKQLIDSEIQNFAWETNKEWIEHFQKINDMLMHYWENVLERHYDLVSGTWVEKKN